MTVMMCCDDVCTCVMCMCHTHPGAMITGEWYMRHQHFSGWARPFEFNSLLFSNVGRHEEARDTARIALRMPWWTLSLGFPTVRELAQLQVCMVVFGVCVWWWVCLVAALHFVSGRFVQGDAAAVTDILNETANNQPNQQFVQRKDAQLEALDKASLLMNQAAAGELEWDAIREPLSERYEEAGYKQVADFVRAAEQG